MTDRPIPTPGSDDFAAFAADPIGWQRGAAVPGSDLPEDLEKWGRATHAMFLALVAGGFNEDQALDIMGRAVSESMAALAVYHAQEDRS
jgi:hypothetical protein